MHATSHNVETVLTQECTIISFPAHSSHMVPLPLTVPFNNSFVAAINHNTVYYYDDNQRLTKWIEITNHSPWTH